MKSKNINKSEISFVVIFSIITLSITFIPIIFGYIQQTDDLKFMGTISAMDSNTYFDYMNQAREGKFIFINSYTSETMKPFLIRPLFWIMGLFTFFLPSIFVWHLFRILLGFCFLFVSYLFISKIITDLFTRKIAFLFLCSSSGFGWLIRVIYILTGKFFISGSVDSNPEANSFVALNAPPHVVASMFLIVLTYYLFLKAIQSNSTKDYILAGLSLMFLGFIHSFDIITIIFITFIFLVYYFFRFKKIVFKSLIFYFFGIIPFIYYSFLLFFNPIFSQWNKQNVIESPNPWGYIMGYGLLLLFALIYFFKWYSFEKILKADLYLVLVLFWFFINPLFFYTPFKIEARFVEGFHIPVVILAAIGFTMLYSKINIKKIKIPILVIVLILLSLSNIFWIDRKIKEVDFTYNPTTKFRNSAFLSYDKLELLDKLNDLPKGIVLSKYHLGNYIPRITGNKVFIGHWAQTINIDAKKQLYDQFIHMNFESQKEFIEEHKIKYFIFEKDEVELIDIDERLYEQLFEKNGMKLLQVKS
jgi:hypothetical protein